MKLFLIRHTTPELPDGRPPQEICYGQSNLPLAESFESEVTALQNKLATFGVSAAKHIYTSPLLRCCQLAHALFPQNAIKIDERITEMWFGCWELTPWEDIPQSQLDSWSSDLQGYRAGGGERFLDLVVRCEKFLDDVLSVPSDDSVVIITHGGVIRAAMLLLLAVPPEDSISKNISFGSVTCIELEKHSREIKNFSIT